MTRTSKLERALLERTLFGLALIGCGAQESGPGVPTAVRPQVSAEPSEDDYDGGEDEGDVENEDEPEYDAEAAAEFNTFVRELGYLPIDPEVAATPVDCDPSNDAMNCNELVLDDETCINNYLMHTEHASSYTASPGANLWPGAVIRSKDLVNRGEVGPLSLGRAPATFSIDLQALNGNPTATMKPASFSEYNERLKNMLVSGVTGGAAAGIRFTKERISNRSELARKLKVGLDWDGVVDLNGLFTFDETSNVQRVLVDYEQVYFNAVLDTPSEPYGFFSNDVRVDDAKALMTPESPPLYVTSVSYGRRLIFAIETSSTVTDTDAAIDAVFDAVDTGASIDQSTNDILAAMSIKVVVYGGNAEAGAKVIAGPDEMMEYILDGGEYSPESPGKPIAFSAAYLDGATAHVPMTYFTQTMECSG